jgi:hypothetical protein
VASGAGLSVGCGDVCVRCARRALGGVEVGPGARLPVAGGHRGLKQRLLCVGISGWAFGGSQVASGAELPVRREDVCGRRILRAPGAVEVGTGAPLPVGLPDAPLRPAGRTSGAIAVGVGARCSCFRSLDNARVASDALSASLCSGRGSSLALKGRNASRAAFELIAEHLRSTLAIPATTDTPATLTTLAYCFTRSLCFSTPR